MMRALICVLAIMIAACSPPREAVRFSILSNESSAATRPDWTPFLIAMRLSTGEHIEAYFGPNYSVLIEAMRFEQTQLGWFGNASAIEAVERSNAEVFAVADRGGYNSLMIVRADRALNLDKVLACDRTLSFGAADPQSTSGTLAPNAYLWGPRALDPQRCFANAKVANHEANILAVSNGLVDLAIVDSAVFARVQARAPEVTAGLTTLWTSPRLPDDPLVWRADLAPELKAKISRFILAYGQGDGPEAEAERAVLAKLGLSGFRAADNGHLDSTRALRAWTRLIEARRTGDPAQIAAAEAAVRSSKANQQPAPQAPD
jgi:phosphonate transport system substrate-binding protein